MLRHTLKLATKRQFPRLLKPISRHSIPLTPRASLVLFRGYAMDTQGQNIDSRIDPLSSSEYDKVSNIYLEDLGDELDIITEDHETIDFDLSQGVLTLNTPKGTYVINRQPPNKQIWLSSPISGPNRYDLIGGLWVSLRDNDQLTELLSKELSDILGTSIQFQLDQ